MIREEDKTEWFKFLAHAFAIVVCVLIASAFCLMPGAWWFSMSRNGIRSLIYCLLICGVIWTALIIKILHATGVFNG